MVSLSWHVCWDNSTHNVFHPLGRNKQWEICIVCIRKNNAGIHSVRCLIFQHFSKYEELQITMDIWCFIALRQ